MWLSSIDLFPKISRRESISQIICLNQSSKAENKEKKNQELQISIWRHEQTTQILFNLSVNVELKIKRCFQR